MTGSGTRWFRIRRFNATVLNSQVWQLWEQRPVIRLALTCGWAATYLATLAIACVVIAQIPPLIVSVPGFHLCGLTAVPKLVRIIWLSPIIFEVLVFVFTVWNAFDRPRHANETLTRALYVDGLLYFVTLSVLRVFNFIITAISPTPLVGVGSCLIWEFNTVALNRLILNQRVPLPVIDNAHLDGEFDILDINIDLECRGDDFKTHRSQRSIEVLTLTEWESFR